MATPRRKKAAPDAGEAVAGEAYSQPSVRAFTTWTPSLIRSAEVSAESGYLGSAAELVDRVMSDDRCQQALETRTGGLQGLPLTFETARRGQNGDAKRGPELEEDWYDSYPEDVLKQIQAWGLTLGIGWGEQVWVLNRGRYVPRLKFWHPQHFRWDHAADQWLVRTGDSGGQEEPIDPANPRWLCYTPYGKHRPWASGLWRGLARWWLLKNYAISDWAQHGEKASRLVVHGTNDMARASASKSQRSQLADDIFDAAKDAVIALPVGFDMKLIEATANTRDIYGAQVEAANNAIVLAVNGQNLTSEVKGGSLAAANVHERVEARRIRSDGETLSTTLRAQSIVYWADWNFGSADEAPWPTWATDPPEDIAAKAGTLDTVAGALVKLKSVGLTIESDALSEEFGLPEFTDVEVVEPEPTAPPASSDGPAPGPAPKDTAGKSGAPQARTLTVASGITAKSDGFIDGQVYADELSDGGRELMAEHLRGGLAEKLFAALDSEDYDGMRAAVLAAYDDEKPPHEVMAKLAKLYVMGHRSGEVAVDQDI